MYDEFDYERDEMSGKSDDELMSAYHLYKSKTTPLTHYELRQVDLLEEELEDRNFHSFLRSFDKMYRVIWVHDNDTTSDWDGPSGHTASYDNGKFANEYEAIKWAGIELPNFFKTKGFLVATIGQHDSPSPDDPIVYRSV